MGLSGLIVFGALLLEGAVEAHLTAICTATSQGNAGSVTLIFLTYHGADQVPEGRAEFGKMSEGITATSLNQGSCAISISAGPNNCLCLLCVILLGSLFTHFYRWCRN